MCSFSSLGDVPHSSLVPSSLSPTAYSLCLPWPSLCWLGGIFRRPEEEGSPAFFGPPCFNLGEYGGSSFFGWRSLTFWRQCGQSLAPQRRLCAGILRPGNRYTGWQLNSFFLTPLLLLYIPLSTAFLYPVFSFCFTGSEVAGGFFVWARWDGECLSPPIPLPLPPTPTHSFP